MLVIENPSARLNTGERAFIAHQRGKKGIALLNFMVGGGGPRKPGREVDAIMLLPHGIFCVEVKHTTAIGRLDAPQNDTWSVGDIATPFSSRDRTPAVQADQAAKILASHLASKDWPKGYITPVVSISGKVTIADNVAWVGTVGVSTVEHFDLIVKQAKTKRLQARHVGPMLMRLGVSASRVPSIERLIAEGFAPDPDEGDEPAADTDAQPTRRDQEGRPGPDPAATEQAPERQSNEQGTRPAAAPRPGIPSPLALARVLDHHVAEPSGAAAGDDRVEREEPDDEPGLDDTGCEDDEGDENQAAEPEPPPGVRARMRRWLHEPLGKDRATTIRTGALTAVVVLFAVWQLMRGDLFMRFIGPEDGHFYFIYGTWQPTWTSVRDSGLPGWSAFAAPLVGAVLVVLFCIAQWLRINVGGATRIEIATFWASAFALIIASPALFSVLGWAGVWLTWLAYIVVWPLVAIVVIEIRKSALREHIEKVWREYEI